MGKPGRPAAGLDDYLVWQERLKSYKASGLYVGDFCVDEGVSKSTFYRWVRRLQDGIPDSVASEGTARASSDSAETKFLPVSLKASPIEIELPNGGIVRVPAGVGPSVLMEVIQIVGGLYPRKRRS